MKYKIKRENFKKTVWPWKKGDPVSKVLSIANALAKEGRLTPAGLESANEFMPKGKASIGYTADGSGVFVNILTPLADHQVGGEGRK
mgnify:CR=1 FL=1